MLTALRILIHDLFIIATFTPPLTTRHSALDQAQLGTGVVPGFSRYRTPRRGDLGTTDESQAEGEYERQYVEGTDRSLVKIAQISRIHPTDSYKLARVEINDA